ncbi:MAG: cytochrome C oxidase subunit II [Acidiferrobacteraceae bacterium]|jgi:cytochrome c oxidase subunit 2|nr:cytochrome C oxidase subunit II [Acidiferrobacteraceae bacterium]MBT3972956.1 cytochrome C oxidase subunit II [Acidiferrobacteraceae bacterium]MBT4395484.1 cytochrome C oxidase subunit II [Acidiferrobacteraceae bacterium]MBT4406047.1 cytochrome C oxidase subunit II [Acidiferrobacteraceae bacterium]MBT4808285.1 cytochrome C oxidase subunit II [Acidiferrobacteraceae bacterium]
MSITPPSERIWWKEPIAKVELIWIIVAFCWGLVMFFMMIYWHGAGEQNLSNEAYRISAEDFIEKTTEMVDQYTVREESGFPVVHPPPGSDVYLIARLWQFWPILELEKDQTYRLHLSSTDWQHGFSLQPVNVNLQIHPGYDMIVTVTPDQSGEYGILCNEFCGIGHHMMLSKMYVVE